MVRKNYRRICIAGVCVPVLLTCLLGWHITVFSQPADFSAVTESVCCLPEEVVSADEVEYIPLGRGDVVRHTYYTLGFNHEHKQANWVYYRLELEGKPAVAERTDHFREDKKVSGGSAKPSDYVKSGYDRGHLCPAGDMTESVVAMSETFYMSNMSPQIPSFNRGIWKMLEGKVRSWGCRERIYVVTGPVFRDDKGTIGRSRVTVPGYYYKLVYSPGKQQMIAFVLPNEKGKKTIGEYVVTVDSVESLTGIDFFPQLSDSFENRLESCSDYEKW